MKVCEGCYNITCLRDLNISIFKLQGLDAFGTTSRIRKKTGLDGISGHVPDSLSDRKSSAHLSHPEEITHASQSRREKIQSYWAGPNHAKPLVLLVFRAKSRFRGAKSRFAGLAQTKQNNRFY